MHFPGHDRPEAYSRRLDIGNAIATTEYSIKGNVRFKREVFASFTDQLIVIRVTSSAPSSINCELYYESPMPAHKVSVTKDKYLRIEGKSTSTPYFEGKVRYVADLKAVASGGKVISEGDRLVVSEADELTLYIAMATNFVNYKDLSADPYKRVAAYMKNSEKPYEKAKAEHVDYYKSQFDRVSLDLGHTPKAYEPMEKRLRNFKVGS